MPFGGQNLKYTPEMKIYIGIFVHESYAKCKARLVGLIDIDNDDDVFYFNTFILQSFYAETRWLSS